MNIKRAAVAVATVLVLAGCTVEVGTVLDTDDLAELHERQSQEIAAMTAEHGERFDATERYCFGVEYPDNPAESPVRDDSWIDVDKCAEAQDAYEDWERRSDALSDRHANELTEFGL